jgi:hypothetical protein
MAFTPDHRVDRYAAGHHGLVTRAVALSCGLTPRQIQHRVDTGRWVPVCRGLYRVASVSVSWKQRALAACLAGPPMTVVSHLTAAAVHGLAEPPAVTHVTVPVAASGHRIEGRVHRSTLGALDRMAVDGIPVTSAARTLLDCAAVLSLRRLCELVDTAFCSGVCHPLVVPEVIGRAGTGKGRTGVSSLRLAIEAWTPGMAAGSPAEMRLLRRITVAGLGTPERQIEIYDDGGAFIGRIDAGWRHLRAGFEYDSLVHHNPRPWQRDETRQLRYAAIGWDVRRVDKHDLLPGVSWLDDHLRRLALRVAA